MGQVQLVATKLGEEAVGVLCGLIPQGTGIGAGVGFAGFIGAILPLVGQASDDAEGTGSEQKWKAGAVGPVAPRALHERVSAGGRGRSEKARRRGAASGPRYMSRMARSKRILWPGRYQGRHPTPVWASSRVARVT